MGNMAKTLLYGHGSSECCLAVEPAPGFVSASAGKVSPSPSCPCFTPACEGFLDIWESPAPERRERDQGRSAWTATWKFTERSSASHKACVSSSTSSTVTYLCGISLSLSIYICMHIDNYMYIYSISKHRKRNTLLNTSQCKRLQQVPEAGSSSAQRAFLKRSGSLCLKPSTKGQTKQL